MTATLSEPQARALRLIGGAGTIDLVTARKWLIAESTLRSLTTLGLLTKESPCSTNGWVTRWSKT
jgi:hypothetical protein